MQSVLHSAYAVIKGRRVHISRQQLIDCVPQSKHVLNWNKKYMCVSAGCEGCYNDVALAFTIMYGVAHEETYTYTSMDGSSDVRTCLFMFSSSSSCTNCFLVGMKNDCMYQKDKVWPQGMVAVPPNNEEKMRRAVEKYGYGWVKMCYCTLFLIQFCAMMNMKFHG